MPAILVLFTQLFRGPLCVLTDSLTERLASVIFTPKLRAADNLLFRRRGFLKRKQLSRSVPVPFAQGPQKNFCG
jgi:hypothetical protein